MSEIASQPILDAAGAPLGCELFDRSGRSDAYTPAGDAALLFDLLHSVESACSDPGQRLFLNCTLQTLAGGHLVLIHPDRVVLQVPPLAEGFSAEDIDTYRHTLESVVRAGFQLAFRDQILLAEFAPLLPLASYIKVETNSYGSEVLARIVAYTRQHSRALLIATKLESQEDLNQAKAAGFSGFQGYWVAWPTVLKTRTVHPCHKGVTGLLELVKRKANNQELADHFLQHPMLAFNLLRYVRTSGFWPPDAVTDVMQALQRLGLRRLFRWSALMYGTRTSQPMPDCDHHRSLTRARMALLLAHRLGADA